MIHRLLLFLLLLAFVSGSRAEQSSVSPLPSSLTRNGELVDPKNGFAIRIDQPNIQWSITKGMGDNFSKYIGVDKERRLVYTIFIDRRRYSEQGYERARKYADGLKEGLRQGGWLVTKSTMSPSSIPREHTYRFLNEVTRANGTQATFVEYMTSPDNLYSLGVVLPAGIDETDFKAFVQTFRLLK